ncbi:MAG: hypothetical protein HOP11_02870 [Saprospiraceae bacterium]|nr:hypothetical protein [Saprospiraceae bacterium]
MKIYLILLSLICVNIRSFSQPGSGSMNINGNSLTGYGSPSGPTNVADDRRVFWIHGLGGDPLTTWNKAAAEYQSTHRIRNTFPAYTQTGLKGGAQNVLEIMNQTLKGTSPTKEPIAVCHSQGGVVARAVLYESEVVLKEQSPIRGIATFDSPHGGALIIDNIDNILQMVEEGCSKLIEGPVVEFVQSKFLLDLFVNAEDIARKVGGLACPVAEKALGIAFKELKSPIGKDYSHTNPSEYFSKLGHLTFPHISKVAFAGYEEEPVLFRQMFWLLNSPESVPAFTANEDHEFVDKFNTLTNTYYSKYKSKIARIEIYNNIACSLHPFCLIDKIIKTNKFRREANAYLNGYNWLTTLNQNWKVMIGAGEYRNTEIGECSCSQYTYDGNFVTEYFIDGICNSGFDECRSNSYPENFIYCDCKSLGHQIFYYDIEPSDAVVPVSSQYAFPGVEHKVKLDKSNHQQCRNDRNTKEALDNLFLGNYGLTFEAKRR